VRIDPASAGPGLKVLSVAPRGPADRAESRLVPGDVLLKVDGQPVGPDRPLERALMHTVGDEVIVEFLPSPQRPPAEPAETAPTSAPAESQPAAAPLPREVVMRPIAYGELNNLVYEAWVDENRKYVAAQSNGRVGYVHIRAMGEASFEAFERDLYAAAHDKDGLIIDVRNNGGGWTADWVMAVLNVRRHAYTVPRGGVPGYPQDRLIFYSWVKPATMVCNQHSFSNAEIVSHAFKNLGRGPLVGMTTAGGVISTGAYRLIDGALVRMPFRGWYTLPDKLDMEGHGAEPDVKVPVTPEDEAAGRKPQLDAAIKATLEQIEQFEPNPAVR
jgi:tricorn protease